MRPFRLKRPEPSEAQILRAVLHALSLHPKVAKVWRMNTGAGKLVRIGTASSQFIRFGFPGCPDVLGFTRSGGTLIAVEVKRPSANPSAKQQAFLDDARSAGCIAFCARDAQDVFAAMENV